jgi:hypothetical protein
VATVGAGSVAAGAASSAPNRTVIIVPVQPDGPPTLNRN